MTKIKKALFGSRDLTRYVIFSLAMVILYTIIAIIYQFISGQELSSTLTTCYFSCFAGEILCSCLIKIFKLKGEGKNGLENETFEP